MISMAYREFYIVEGCEQSFAAMELDENADIIGNFKVI